LNYIICSTPAQAECAKRWTGCPYEVTFKLPPIEALSGSNTLYWSVQYRPEDGLQHELARAVGARIRVIRGNGEEVLPETYDDFKAYAAPLAVWVEPTERQPEPPEPLVTGPEAPPEPVNGHAVAHANGFIVNDKGHLKPLVANAILMLRETAEWQALRWNAFAQRIEVGPGAPIYAGTLEDHQTVQMAEWFQRQGLLVGRDIAFQAADVVARDRTFHPVLEYLGGLEWDGIERCPHWLHDWCETADTPYVRAVSAKWLVSAVARIYQPGCKVDTVLVLSDKGQGGLYKSSALRELVGEEWFSDDMPDLRDRKDAAQHMAGIWVNELSELDSVRSADIERVFSFISRRVDRYRPPYGRLVVDQPRQSVLCGTTNLSEHLRGGSNQRRWWPVTILGKIDLGKIRDHRDQLWAEAVHRYRQGEPWWLSTDQEQALARDETEVRVLDRDEWEPLVSRWLAGREEATVGSALEGAVGLKPDKWDRGSQMRMGAILRGLGYARTRSGGEGRPWVYRR